MARRAGFQQRERQHFDQLAATTGEIWWGSATMAGKQRLRRRAELITAELAGHPDPVVLEIGCGTGAFSRALLELRPSLRLVGCDISPVSLDKAMQHCANYPSARFVEADATDLAFEPASFDAVVGNSVLHHLPARRVTQQAHALLASGGLLWFSEPNMLNPQIAVEKNIHFIGKRLQNTEDETAFFRWQMDKLLREVGFGAVSVEPFDFLHPIVPQALIGIVDRMGRLCERVPLVREIAGSLVICAHK